MMPKIDRKSSVRATHASPFIYRRAQQAAPLLIFFLALQQAQAAEPVELTGFTDPGRDPATPIIARFYPTGAGCTTGDNDRVGHQPPWALVDGRAETAWTQIQGTAPGAFASFRLLTPAYGLTRIGVRPLPAVKHPQKYDRPRVLLLVTETRSYRLIFEDDPLNQPAETVWFDLPEPDSTGCFSLVIKTSYAPADSGRLALAEVVVRTEAEDGRGRLGIAADLNNPERRRQAALLLEQAGALSLRAIETVWPDLDRQGRLLAVGVIGRIDPVAGAPVLADAFVNGTEAEQQAANRGLAAAGPAAVTALAAMAGKGGPTQRRLLRRHISSFAARGPEPTARLGELIAGADARSDKELLYDLLRAAASRPKLHAQISGITARYYAQSIEFPDRYRLLALMGRLPCVDFQAQLTAAATDPDHLIRAIAVTGLGGCKNPAGDGIELCRQALEDDAPEVRLAALHAMAKRSVNDPCLPLLTRLADADPWPTVRAQVAVAAGRLLPAQAIPILEIATRDSSPKVRAAALKSSVSFASPEVDKLIEERLLEQGELPQIKRIAAETAGRRCRETALLALLAVLQKGAEPLAAPEDVSSAVSAASAIGAIGGEQAAALLKEAKRRSNPLTDRAIRAALQNLGEPCIAR
ncbi:MAG: hypothetical protein GY762_03000 [Proteobacteria bacterium]|nr:hypothetical protein [Pseudomonadota bacterium]